MRTLVLLALVLAGCNFADVTAFANAAPLGYANWQVGAVVLWLGLTIWLKRQPADKVRANDPLELLANLLVRVPLVGKVAQPLTTPGTVARTAGPPPVSLILALFLFAVPACGHAAQAARGTFATVAAAEHSYARWATSEVDRLVAKAQADCPKEPDRAACVERITGSTFRAIEITDAALTSYHEAQRAASICLAKGGAVLACTTASAKAAGVLLEQLGAVGFKVLQ